MDLNYLLTFFYHGQTRKTGEPSATHPQAVRNILFRHGIVDPPVLTAALLHDVLEDTKIPRMYLVLKFGRRVTKLVNLLSKNRAWRTPYCRMKSCLDAMEGEWRIYPEAVLIKMADRLHNLRTIHGFSPEKQKEYLQETKAVLLPCFQKFLAGNDLASLTLPARNIYRELVKEIRSIEKSLC